MDKRRAKGAIMADMLEPDHIQEKSQVVPPENKNYIKIWGNDKTMNLSHQILTNILSSSYYKKGLSSCETVLELIDKIYEDVNHVEAWERGTRQAVAARGLVSMVRGVGEGGVVSSAFCCLYKLFKLKPSKHDLYLLLNHQDSPYIRAIGFLFIRHCVNPNEFWKWFEPYIDDSEEIYIRSGNKHKTTIGEMIQDFLKNNEWFGSILPRIPVKIQSTINEELEKVLRSSPKFSYREGRPNDRNKKHSRHRSPDSDNHTSRKPQPRGSPEYN